MHAALKKVYTMKPLKQQKSVCKQQKHPSYENIICLSTKLNCTIQGHLTHIIINFTISTHA